MLTALSVTWSQPGGQILLGQAQGPALAADEITQPLFVHGRSPRVQPTPAGGIWQPTSGREESSAPTGGCFCRNAMSCHQHGCFPPPKWVASSLCEYIGPLLRADCTKVKFCLLFKRRKEDGSPRPLGIQRWLSRCSSCARRSARRRCPPACR